MVESKIPEVPKNKKVINEEHNISPKVYIQSKYVYNQVVIITKGFFKGNVGFIKDIDQKVVQRVINQGMPNEYAMTSKVTIYYVVIDFTGLWIAEEDLKPYTIFGIRQFAKNKK